MMKRHISITGRLACILIALAFAWGCGEQPDTARPPKVVRKKINLAAKPSSPAGKRSSARAPAKASAPSPRSDIAREKPPGGGSASPAAAPAKATAASGKELRPKSDLAREPLPSGSGAAAVQKPAPPTPQPEAAAALPAAGSVKTALQPKSEPSEEKPKATPAAETKQPEKKEPAAQPVAQKQPAAKKGEPLAYNPEGKTDPFKPLFEEKPELPQKRSRPKRIPRTPLERVALSQLKLTAIILAPSGNRALVQEATGKGYVIQNGTYIGLNAGKVVDIQKDRVIIEEEVEDILGKLTKREQQLTLPKPAGER